MTPTHPAADPALPPSSGPRATPPLTAGPRLLHTLTLRNLLSLGPDAPPLHLASLNVLLGPNGSGNSNLLEALALLRSTPADLRSVFLRGGGVGEWIWKGAPQDVATLDALLGSADG